VEGTEVKEGSGEAIFDDLKFIVIVRLSLPVILEIYLLPIVIRKCPRSPMAYRNIEAKYLVSALRCAARMIIFGCVTMIGSGGVSYGQSKHWAYEAPVRGATGQPGKHPIDDILENKWKEAGLEPPELAAPRLWVERAAYTLTGLPPSLEQIRRIEAEPNEETWQGLIDEFLSSTAYGERWARHWMDVARYADTQGYNFDRDNRYPFAYTYRDLLIKSFHSRPTGKHRFEG